MKKNYIIFSKIFLTVFLITFSFELTAQQNSATHTRGKLWETLYNWGFIGDPGAWDYTQITGIGFFPGFAGYDFPDNEELANGYITDANFHNFRSGPWIIAKDALTPIPPSFTPERRDFLIYHSSLATGDNGVLDGNIMPFIREENFIENESFNPLLPEETNYVEFPTSTGIRVKQRSTSWSFPGYDDFIIYDYTFVNTGEIAVPSVNQVVPLPQTLSEVWFVFHSGIQVSTKGVINFHYDDDFLSSTAPAGSFGWHPGGGYTDYYAVENDQTDGKGLLYYSRDYNGGRNPVPWDQHGIKNNWQSLLTVPPYTIPELQDPAAFGFQFLYRTPPPGSNGDPFDADPTFFNIYSDEGAAKFNGKTVDFESFGLSPFSQQEIYQFATHSTRPSNSSNLYCWYTGSFGPYNLAPGDSIRLVVVEIAGVMDLNQVLAGDPNFWFPDSTIADIRRNSINAMNAVRWGIGANVNGINIAADVPEPPPAPVTNAVNASRGSDSAIVAVQWGKVAEETIINDRAGIFYDGSTDLDGYRIFRGSDRRGIWTLLADIPRSEFIDYWNPEINQYEYKDTTVNFGFSYNYYVQAYNSTPRSWTSANNTLVENLGELISSDVNRSAMTTPRPGPVSVSQGWDVFVVPNPYVDGDPERSFPGSEKIEFRNLPEKATIKIFSVSGDLVKTLNHGPDEAGNLFGSAEWDQRSDSGLRVAPGLYIYVIESQAEETAGSRSTGKLMIIR